jgi:hypothetical protein
MSEQADWSSASYEGNRRRQHQEFYALSLREKIERLEQMQEVIARLGTKPNHPGERPHEDRFRRDNDPRSTPG